MGWWRDGNRQAEINHPLGSHFGDVAARRKDLGRMGRLNRNLELLESEMTTTPQPTDVVTVPKEVLDLYQFMAMAFAPFTSQQEEIAISLRLAKKAMAGYDATRPAQLGGGVDDEAIDRALLSQADEDTGMLIDFMGMGTSDRLPEARRIMRAALAALGKGGA